MQSLIQPSSSDSIQAKGFELWYQPAYDFSSGSVQHNEVLLRWRDSKGQLFLPRDFMPWVSQAQMKLSLDKLVIRRAIQQAARFPEAQLSINLSPEAIQSHGFANFVFEELSQSQVLPQSLKFEISELHAAQNFRRAISFIRDLKAIGCSVVLDNFSNDHLTFMQWERLEVDSVKVNGQLMSDCLGDQERFLLAKAITDASVQMGQEAVAKSIDELMASRLFDECDFGSAQGYQLKRPSRRLSLTSKVDVLGISLDNLTKSDFLEQLESGVVFTPNVDHLMNIRKDPEYRQAYSIADYKLCNSQFLLMASRVLGDPLPEKLVSSDIFQAFCEYHQHNTEMSLFLLGEGTVPGQAADIINQRSGRDVVVGHYAASNQFESNDLECERMIRCINQSNATVLVLGLQSPMQEKWVYRYQSRLPHIKIIFALGDALGIEAGLETKVPRSVGELGGEWFYRLLQHPNQLWKRYLIDDAPFLWLLMKQKMFK